MTQHYPPPTQPTTPPPEPELHPQYEVVPGNAPATTAMVLGIVGVALAMVPILGLFAFPLGLLAVIFGAVGLRKHGRETPKGKGAAITGLVLGALCFVLAIVGMTIVNDAFDELDDAFDEFDAEMEELERELDEL